MAECEGPAAVPRLADPVGVRRWPFSGCSHCSAGLFDERRRPPPPPLMPWSWPRDWFAVFDYEGPMEGIDGACRWLATTWPARAGLRLGNGPLFSLLHGVGEPGGPAKSSTGIAFTS